MLHPFWLALLGPWAAMSVWLLLRRRAASVAVPFLKLWPATASAAPTARRRFVPPPAALAAAIAGMFLSILAAAGPVVGAHPAPITVIVDRGLHMSDLAGGAPRFVSATRRASAEIAAKFPSSAIELIDVPGGSLGTCDADQLVDKVAALPRTAADAREQLAVAVAHDKPDVVLTDQLFSTPGVGTIAPSEDDPGTFIASFSMRAMPSAQAMVRLLNRGSEVSPIVLQIDSGGQTIRHTVEAPSPGAWKDYFIDLPAAGEQAEARILSAPVNAQSQAYLTMRSPYARLAPGVGLPVSVEKMIAAYQKLRPLTESSPTVYVEPRLAALPADGMGVALSAPDEWAPATRPTSDVSVSAQYPALVDHLNWEDVAARCATARTAPSGWTPVVQSGSQTLLAIQEHPRRVWIGFDVDAMSKSPAFVVLWDQVFSFLAGGGQREYASIAVGNPPADSVPMAPPSGVEANQWPGFYRAADGSVLAFNAPDTPWPTRSDVDLARLPEAPPVGNDLSWMFCAAALVALLCAALMWKTPAESRG